MNGFKNLVVDWLEQAKPYAIGFAIGLICGWLL